MEDANTLKTRLCSAASPGLRFLGLTIALSVALPIALAIAPMARSDGTSPRADFPAEALIASYIESWSDFYPSRAFAYGRLQSAAQFEDYSGARVDNWLSENVEVEQRAQALLNENPDTLDPATRVDLQVLLAQAENEQARWLEDAPLSRQPQWYAEQLSQALTHLLVRDRLTEQGRSDAAIERLRGVQALLRLGVSSLTAGNALRTASALRTLRSARVFYAGTLREFVDEWPPASDGSSLVAMIDVTVPLIVELEKHLKEQILPNADTSASIGAASYNAKLRRRSFASYQGATLEQDAHQEMHEVRELMVAEAQRWRESRSDLAQRNALSKLAGPALLNTAIDAMESDRQINSSDFLASFRDLTWASERFVEENGIASIPKPTTLLIDLSPAHFSGAAVGGVYPSGPFAPDADTLFYVPSISDSASEEAREKFYRSFNTHFNTMILAHEMFPGHYLQYKVAVAQAPALRSLFPNGPYVEGWGSFVEELMLDAGWADNAPLTRLAHLRKRLENATRAYVSVKVHTAAWGENEVLEFAVEEGLLAPQFATNLWQRVVNSPLQITDYFTGYSEFKTLYARCQCAAREGADNTATRAWVDAVLRAGPLAPRALLGRELERALGAGDGDAGR